MSLQVQRPASDFPVLSLRDPTPTASSPVLSQAAHLSVFSLLLSPTKELNRKLSSDEMYLVDSGGQYW